MHSNPYKENSTHIVLALSSQQQLNAGHSKPGPLGMEYTQLGPLSVPRLFIGLWQLSSNAWGTAPVSKIRAEMKRHVDEGFTAFGP